MRSEREPPLFDLVTALAILEGLGWAVCLLASLAAMQMTFREVYPMQRQSLVAEAIATGTALAMALLSVRRAWRSAEPGPRSRARARWALAGIVARCFVGMPVHVFFVICAAAGFAA